MKKKRFQHLPFWIVLFNWPPKLVWIPIKIVKVLLIGPYLLWINIPGLVFGIGRAVGRPHFIMDGDTFATPKTPTAWFILTMFWVLVAMFFTLISGFLESVFVGVKGNDLWE